MMSERIDKDAYYLGIAREVAERSTCLRRRYGAVIVKNDEIISTGYNGAARGEKNCCDLGECWREAHNIPHGEQYEKCVAVHAEQNAVISAARRDMIGATLYLAGYEYKPLQVDLGQKGSFTLDGWIPMNGEDVKPCLICKRMIQNAGIARVVTVCSSK